MSAAILAAAAAGIALLRGGSLDRLAATRFVWLPLLLVALAVQVGFSLLPLELPASRQRILLLMSYTLMTAFLALNLRLPGMAIAAAGLILNIVVIAANGAMPVSISAARSAGVETSFESAGLKHEALSDDTTLGFLADVIPIPGLSEVISVGDVLLALGVAWLVYARTVAPPPDRRERTITAAGD